MLDTVIRFFQEGGPFMYPIAIVLALGLAITLERFLYLGAVRRRNRVAFERGILPALQKRDYQRGMKAASSSDSAIASVLGAGAVLVTDLPSVLPTLRHNVRANGLDGCVRCEELSWVASEDELPAAFAPDGAEMVLGSDLLNPVYGEEHAEVHVEE